MASGRLTNTLLAVLVVTVVALLATLLMPRLKLGSMGSGQATEVLQQHGQHVQRLEAEVAQLRTALAEAQLLQNAAPSTQQKLVSAATSNQDPVAAVDLMRMLGVGHYYSGVSFDAHYSVIKDITEADMTRIGDDLTKELVAAMSKLLGRAVPPNTAWPLELTPGAPHNQQADVMARDPRTRQWRDKMSAIFAKYMLSYNNTWALQCGRENQVPVLSTAGQDPCPLLSDAERVAQLGYHPVPQGPIQGIARDSIKYGVCMKSPEQRSSFGEWIIQERMHNPAWKTFNVPELDQDAVVLLFDLLYESLGVFKKQYWLGVITMQNPFDMMSINDIIYTIQPDLIIETGTANGGSALMWASMLHLAGLASSKVITVDVSAPSWSSDGIHWGGKPRANATSHELWTKHVNFVQGPSTERQTLDKVKALLKPGQKVMVLLDSAHYAQHVLAELSEYCQFVTVNSYCIVQDTKLGRWSMDSRMLSTVKQWLSKGVGSKFAVDRDRELLYTHHAMG
ncbi:hypothetical protein QJQ45_026227 [Haematococcus lacustris]|nr:hypothetical protein QJQ45_026227 [Haematococcus lacustris]